MKRFRIIALILSLLMLMTITIGCTEKKESDNELKVEDIEQVEDIDQLEDEAVENKNFPVEVQDKFGNTEIIEEEPMTIISLAPSNTETLFALGLGDRVVGVTPFCDYPEEAQTKEKVGDYSGNNLERIIELEPDLILVYGPGDEEENRILREAGIKVLGFLSETMDDIMKDIETIGKATGRNEKAADIINSIKEKRDYILEKVKDAEEVTVFYEIWHDPLMGAGKGSFMDELITLAGGKNIAYDTDGAYPQYDLEQLIERDPQVYLASKDSEDKTIESIKLRPGYDAISAIKNDRIYLFKGNEANLVSRPGPRIGEALEVVAKAIHPELFE
ncbi:MAG: cobalamin-binding protein [Tissierellia bacterium]|nr:cobalamin-binding protein [Tissierellia bacterium]